MLYTFRNFSKWENIEGTDLVDPDCRIIYDENDILKDYFEPGFIELDESIYINVGRIRKLSKNWYFGE
jgi:hypothetical protein